MAQVHKRAAAKRDLVEHYVYLAENSGIENAERFLLLSYESFTDLARHPEMGVALTVCRPELGGMRKWQVKGFEKILIFYVPRPHGVSILRLLHASQDWWSLLGIILRDRADSLSPAVLSAAPPNRGRGITAVWVSKLIEQRRLIARLQRFAPFPFGARSEFAQGGHERVVLLIDGEQRITAPAAASNATLTVHARVVLGVIGAAALPFDVCDLQHGG